MGKVMAVVSAQGGAGKTMFASNLASCLAIHNYKVLLIDMNSGSRRLDLCFGLESQVVYDLGDIMNGICKIKKALIKDSRFYALYLLSASQNVKKAEIKTRYMKKLCEKLSEKFDYVIIDTPCSLSEEWETSVACAQDVVLIATQEYSSVRSAEILCKRLTDMRISRLFTIVNHVRTKHSENDIYPALSDISESLREPITGVIQEDENIHVAMNSGTPVVCHINSYIAKNFVNIIKRMAEQ